MTTQAPLFGTHRTIDRLINGGFDQKQTEAIAEALDTALSGSVATSTDIARLETRLTIRGIVALFVTGSVIVGLIGSGIAYATNLILSAIAG